MHLEVVAENGGFPHVLLIAIVTRFFLQWYSIVLKDVFKNILTFQNTQILESRNHSETILSHY